MFLAVLQPRTYVSAVFIATRLPLGMLYFTVLLTGLVLGLSGALVIIGIPAIVLTFVAARGPRRHAGDGTDAGVVPAGPPHLPRERHSVRGPAPVGDRQRLRHPASRSPLRADARRRRLRAAGLGAVGAAPGGDGLGRRGRPPARGERRRGAPRRGSLGGGGRAEAGGASRPEPARADRQHVPRAAHADREHPRARRVADHA